MFSSRKLERATYDSVAFRFIAANDHPDHDTIATFRRRFLKDIAGLFVRVLELAREMGLLAGTAFASACAARSAACRFVLMPMSSPRVLIPAGPSSIQARARPRGPAAAERCGEGELEGGGG